MKGAALFVLVLAFAGTAAAQPAPGGAASGETVRGAAKVTTGDELLVNEQAVTLYGIDAPEPGQVCRTKRGREFDCGAGAKTVLERIVGGGEVVCEIVGRHRQGKVIGRCRVNGQDVGALMVAVGYAFAYRSIASAYAAVEDRAQRHKRGLWAGRVEMPWNFRDRRVADPSAPPGPPNGPPAG
ncbi:MAG TPA: thermonuclease family protein [Alphaproteobacteria bacterium]|nr:thermonuclease family protein [Alphaproteobacteria bacterium]